MIFVTRVYPNLMFYIPSREEPFRFAQGVFDTSDLEGKERTEVEAVLSKLVANPGVTGVQLIEETKYPFACDYCGKGFQTQAAMYGHKGAHKTPEQINKEALAEGSAVPSTANS